MTDTDVGARPGTEMKPQIYRVPGPWPGRLAILPRPRGGGWLRDEVAMWREAGLDVVTSLLTPEEVAELELQEEEALAREQGLEFHAFPIPDRGVPESRVETAELIRVLEKALASGRNVAIHCRQGVGRSALIAASLLSGVGQDPEQAFVGIESARGVPVPDTAEQREWVQGCLSGVCSCHSPAVKLPRRSWKRTSEERISQMRSEVCGSKLRPTIALSAVRSSGQSVQTLRPGVLLRTSERIGRGKPQLIRPLARWTAWLVGTN